MLDLSSSVMEIATINVQTLPQTATIMNATKFMLSKNFRRFPITDAGTKRLRGVVTATDFVNFFGGGSKHGIVRNRYNGNLAVAVNAEVKEIMERDVVYIEKDASIEDLVELMFEKKVGGCPVVDEDGVVIGIVTERDILKLLAKRRKIDGITSDFMTKNVVTIGAKDTIETAMKTMIKKKFRRLPVIEDGILLGLITSREILAYFGRGEAFKMLEYGDVGEAIRKPVSTILWNSEINMHRDVLILPKDVLISQVVSSMIEKGHGVALIVEKGRLEGIITEKDLIKFLYESS
ncbi:MAG: CBS domain-containing protein [Archaeoglobaceae archaeon]|nr:CBS domain-containing protein [Archaeoglobaceae archaeon]MDW7989153.1 CBS domain-containing protein [Archaeoglobaceae archaeon]